MPKVSVIIPVFNAEATIERCAVHLFEQTLDDIEYLFIDDCSQDKSIELLEKTIERYPSRKSHVRIVRMPENLGSATIREYGVKNTSGDFLIHCDSDDWPEVNMYEKMVQLAELNDYDMVISNYWFDVNETHYNWGQNFQDKDLIHELFVGRLSGSVWNKLIKKEIIKEGFVFPTSNTCEDFLYVTQYILNSSHIGFLDEALYHYVYHPSSSIHDMSCDAVLHRHRQIVDNISKSILMIKKSGQYSKYESAIVAQCYYVKNALKGYVSHKDVWLRWKHVFKEYNTKILFCKSLKWNQKILYCLIALHIYPLYTRLKKNLFTLFK